MTGSNRGIGLQIVKGLLSKSFRVILCSRTLEKGLQARQQLLDQNFCQEENHLLLNVVQLDLDDPQSIKSAHDDVVRILGETNNGQLDVLTYSFSVDEVKESMQTNFKGTMSVTNAMLPLMKKGGRIIFVSSAVGKTYLVLENLSKRLLCPTLTEQGLEKSWRILKCRWNKDHMCLLPTMWEV